MRRFLSSDPAGFDGGWNMFAYGNGNPLAMVDPFGLGARSSNESGFWSDFSGYWGGFGNGAVNTVTGIAGAVMGVLNNLYSIGASTYDIAASGYAMQATYSAVLQGAESAYQGATQGYTNWQNSGGYISASGAGEVMGGVWAGTVITAGTSTYLNAANSGASMNVNATRLARQLTSEEQLSQAMLGQGEAMMGAGTTKPLYQSTTNRLVQEYGGASSDWTKMGGNSSALHGTTTPAGANFEIHWYQNMQTGQAVEFKTKLLGH
jgi:hypothetical protein